MDINSSITPDLMTAILGLADEDAEPILFRRLAQIVSTMELGYMEVGLICREVDAYLLWEKRIDPETGQPCTSFSRWVHVCCPRSYATVYAAMRDVEALKDIPDQHLAEIPSSNVPVVKQLSTAVRADPKVLHAAKTKRNEEFVEQIRRDHPDQHIEARKLLRFKLEESAAERVEAALRMAEAKGAKNWSEALELICEEAIAREA